MNPDQPGSDRPVSLPTTVGHSVDPGTTTAPGGLDAPSSSPSNQTPSLIGRFEVRSLLGEGAFGTVFRAYDPRLDREVALKVAKPSTLMTPQSVERFLREAKAAAGLRHPNIVPLYETGRAGEHHFIVSAFIAGRSLGEAIEEKALDSRRAVEVVRRLAEALAYAHKRGVVHRDVKPSNVMLDEQGDPLLADFGLASRQEDEAKLTQDGAVMGTPAYMPPEQAAGRTAEVGPAADQYSLGCVLYELLTGRTPFAGPVNVQIYQHVHEPVAAPRSVAPDVPRDLETICLKCLEKDPKGRYADCQSLADDLRRWLDGEPIKARPLDAFRRADLAIRRFPAIALFGLCALGIAAACFALTNGGFLVTAVGVWLAITSTRRVGPKATAVLAVLTGGVLAVTASAASDVSERSGFTAAWLALFALACLRAARRDWSAAGRALGGVATGFVVFGLLERGSERIWGAWILGALALALLARFVSDRYDGSFLVALGGAISGALLASPVILISPVLLLGEATGREWSKHFWFLVGPPIAIAVSYFMAMTAVLEERKRSSRRSPE